MLEFTIKSRKFGDIVFTAKSGGGYIRCCGRQICEGGGYTGPALAVSTEKGLERLARAWHLQRMQQIRNGEIDGYF